MINKLFANGCPVCELKTGTTKHCSIDTHDYVRCDDCGLIYQTGELDADDMLACYTGGPIKRLRRKILNGFRKLEKQRDFQLRMTRAREIFNFSSAKSKLPKGKYLDIGCNKGFNLYAAEESGWEAHGNELIEEIVIPIKNSKPALKQRIKNGSFLDLAKTYGSEEFELITCIDVIEHLTEPKLAMQEILRMLKPGGVAIFQTPDASTDNVEMKASWNALKPNEHLLLFDTKNFATMLRSSGYSEIEFCPPFEVCDGNFVAVCSK